MGIEALCHMPAPIFCFALHFTLKVHYVDHAFLLEHWEWWWRSSGKVMGIVYDDGDICSFGVPVYTLS